MDDLEVAGLSDKVDGSTSLMRMAKERFRGKKIKDGL